MPRGTALQVEPHASAPENDPPPPADRRLVLPLLVPVAFALVVAYALLVPAGLPYDEPSHWQNVLYIVHHWSLPVLGSPETSHEAVMGPVVYVVDALVFKVLAALGAGEHLSFLVIRATGAVWMMAFAALTFRLTRRCLPTIPEATCLAAVAVAVFNPILLAVGSSVQNDIPSLTFALLALDVAAGGALTPSRATLVGGLAGLAILTKLTTWPVLAVLMAWMLGGAISRSKARVDLRALWSVVLLGLAAVAVTGWWFVRNEVLYHDLTGQAGAEAAGYRFAPIGWHGVSTLSHLVRLVVTFLWIPVEYWRNQITAPPWIELIVIGAFVVVLAGLLRVRLLNARAIPIAALAAVSVVTWAVVTMLVEGAAFRIAYLCLPAWAILVALALTWLPRQWMRIGACASVLCILHVWVLASVAGLTLPSMIGGM